MYPAYLESFRNGNLAQAIKKAGALLESCSLCPRKCGVNRLKNEQGFCKTGLKARICSFMPHHGEEPAVSGRRGSGTVFFSHCNMACVYCQNYEFSQEGQGREVDEAELAQFMLGLARMGCHNINLVTPTHVLPQILKSLELAISDGLKIPLVYNTGGYELAEILKLLDGIVDIYLPDMRYAEPEAARRYSAALDYPAYNQEAIKEMHRQVGTAQIDDNGIITRGLIIRHLVLPSGLAGTDKIMAFIAGQVSKDTYISLMSQYFPCFCAQEYPEIARRITSEEYQEAQASMQRYGLHNGWTQQGGGLERFAGINIKPNL